MAWLGAAAAIAYLAFLQLDYSGTGLVGSGQALQLAIFNGVSALITGYFGARVVTRARPGDFLGGTVWAVLNVAWGAYQVSQGVSHPAFILALVLMALAGLLSFVAWRQAPAEGTGGLSTTSKVLMVAIGVVVIGAAVLLVQRM